MNKLFFTLLILLISMSGCEKIDKLTQFDMGYKMTVVIPSSSGINLPFNIFSPDVETNSESTFAIYSTSKDLIEEVLLTKLKLTLNSPSNGNLDFIKTIEIFISADGLAEQKVAWKENVPSGRSVELELTQQDLKEYIKKDEFKLRLNTVTNKFLTSEHTIEVDASFFVDASVLGQ